MAIVKHGITETTPSNILLGAGAYFGGLKYTSNDWTGTILGATTGGGKVNIKGELIDLDIDGALVKFKGQTVKQGGVATFEINFAEASKDVLKMGTLFKEGTSDVTGFTLLEDKATIESGDYIEDLGFVGYTADGSKRIIVIFENAICTSGLDVESKDKEQSVIKLTFEAVADVTSNLDKLPVKIYYPTEG